ncbi:conserved hypothetical protein [Flavobacterium sp. 9AF]|uniref:hypothetical protein n=1 Tax=Flavobacterium sp. 9AF TaxID=2653142 RepID=UPI0012F10193|nr:hypothetical protein [Flavobacterium sp. 9AF]VXC37712.1 conserved hypothetical protein [Flavobacterium sp. 9AF]
MFHKSNKRTFNYKPRFSSENQLGNATSSGKDFVSQWKNANSQNRKTKTPLPISVLLLLLVLLLIGIYVLDSYIN